MILCQRCECQCACCQELMALGVATDPRVPRLALVPTPIRGAWFFLDYVDWLDGQLRWAIRGSTTHPQDGSFEVFSPVAHAPTHESALHLLAREMHIAREAIAILHHQGVVG